ncbi:hypothetical protein ACFLXA_02920 [Chloroflexota bacterium]
MAAPTGQVMHWDASTRNNVTGAVRDFWMKFPGLRAASDADSPGGIIYYLENPFKQDLVILEALAVITTVDAQDGDIDVGLADDADGTSVGAEIFDSIVNTAAGVFAGLAASAVAGTTSRPIWKAPGSSTDSFLCIDQNGDADVSALRWNLLLRVIPYDDLLDNMDLDATHGACPVA